MKNTNPDTVVMPRELTAENRAKALLMGEFYSEVEMTCDWCDGEGFVDNEGCEACRGAGDYTMRVPVTWTTIKAIYAKAVEHLGVIESA